MSDGTAGDRRVGAEAWRGGPSTPGGGPSLVLDQLDAVLFDLDGVLTDTASLHATAWESVFNELFERVRGTSNGIGGQHPFTGDDYRRLVDGEPASTEYATCSPTGASLFVFPVVNLRFPEVSRDLLRYRQRRLPAARRFARAAGDCSARFPWQYPWSDAPGVDDNAYTNDHRTVRRRGQPGDRRHRHLLLLQRRVSGALRGRARALRCR